MVGLVKSVDAEAHMHREGGQFFGRFWPPPLCGPFYKIRLRGRVHLQTTWTNEGEGVVAQMTTILTYCYLVNVST